MRMKRMMVWSAMPVAVALAATACGGGGSNSSGEGSPDPNGTLTINSTEPQCDAFTVACNNDQPSIRVLKGLYTPLTTFDPVTGKDNHQGVAQSIETQDATTYTIKLKPWKFQ